MDPEPQIIRENIEETRSNLTEKLEILEKEVIGTVKDAREAVAETVETVKETVENTVENVKESFQETVESVKDSFNLRRQMEAHPWAFIGAATAAGFLLGAMVPPSRRVSRGMARASADTGSFGQSGFQESLSSLAAGPRHESYSAPHATHAAPAAAPRHEGPSFLGSLFQQFQPEIQQLKGLAIGAGIGLLRDMLRDSIPPALTPQIDNVISNITTKLGGQEIKEPILSQDDSNEQGSRRGSFAGANV